MIWLFLLYFLPAFLFLFKYALELAEDLKTDRKSLEDNPEAYTPVVYWDEIILNTILAFIPVANIVAAITIYESTEDVFDRVIDYISSKFDRPVIKK